MTGILFVDDEVKVLEGLQRMLRPYRNQWNMRFASSARQALSMLEESPADVVVSDMRMPGMDGAELLERISELYPSTIRVVLSGQFDVHAGLRLTKIAHQLLAKPCRPSDLHSTIQRLLSSNAQKVSEQTRRVAGSIGTLPSPPNVCIQLQEALRSGSASIEDLVRIVGKDAALCAKILQLVNSAFFGLPRQVVDIRAAIAALGLDVLRQLVLITEIARQFQPKSRIAGFQLDAFTNHANLAAAIARSFYQDSENRAAALMAGLLHDAGKLVIATRIPADFGRALEMSKKEKMPLFACEIAVCGCSHAEIGGYLLQLWGLPEPIVDAVSAHHQLPTAAAAATTLPLSLAVHLANAYAHELEAGVEAKPGEAPLDADRALDALFTPKEWSAWRVSAQAAHATVSGSVAA